MIILKMIEILQKFLIEWGQWKMGPEFESNPITNQCIKIIALSFQRIVGFHDINQKNWVSPSGFLSFFSPYRILLKLSFSPHLTI
jgi:hypothetical protein